MERLARRKHQRRLCLCTKLFHLNMPILAVDLAGDGRFAASAGKDQALHALVRKGTERAHRAGSAEVILMGKALVKDERRSLSVKQIDVSKAKRDIGKVARSSTEVFDRAALLTSGKIEHQALGNADLVVFSVGHRGHQTARIFRKSGRDLPTKVLLSSADRLVGKAQRLLKLSHFADLPRKDTDPLVKLCRVGCGGAQTSDLVTQVGLLAPSGLKLLCALADPLKDLLVGHIAKRLAKLGRKRLAKLLLVLVVKPSAKGSDLLAHRLLFQLIFPYLGKNRVDLGEHRVDDGADPNLGQRPAPTPDRIGKRGIRGKIGSPRALDLLLGTV